MAKRTNATKSLHTTSNQCRYLILPYLYLFWGRMTPSSADSNPILPGDHNACIVVSVRNSVTTLPCELNDRHVLKSTTSQLLQESQTEISAYSQWRIQKF